MRLHQIYELRPSDARGLRDITDKTAIKLKNFLKQHGFEKLGQGVYSSVWGTNQSNNVVKIADSYGDKCWLVFAEYASKNKNKHFPRISSVKIYIDETSGEMTYYCFMEKLYDIRNIPKTQKNKPLIAYLITRFGLDYPIGEKNWKNLFEDFNFDFSSTYGSKTHPEVVKAANQYIDRNSFENAIEILKNAKIENCRWDLHSGNIMWRKSSNTLVITDPFAKTTI